MATIAGSTEKFPGLFYDKGGAVFHVRHPEFGAVGNGVTDDTAAIEAADAAACDGTLGVDGATVLAQGIVYFPQGTYKIPYHIFQGNRTWTIPEFSISC